MSDNSEKNQENKTIIPDGLYLFGQIMAVEVQESTAQGRKDKFLVDVYAPGHSAIFRVSVSATEFAKFQPGNKFKGAVLYSVFKDKAYWSAV